MSRHAEYRKLIPNAKTVIVFIHGILGTPRHFDIFLPFVPESMSICTILLKGHGGTVSNYSKSTMQDWKQQVKEEIDGLSLTHENILLVAHSMGCLFSMENAKMYPKSIKGLFLLAPPLRIILSPSIILASLRVVFNIENKNDERLIAGKKSYGVDADKNLIKYLAWIPNFMSLLKESKRGRQYAKEIKIPSQIFLSKKDEMILTSSAKYFKKNENSSIHILQNSQHYYYEKYDCEFLLENFKTFCITFL